MGGEMEAGLDYEEPRMIGSYVPSEADNRDM